MTLTIELEPKTAQILQAKAAEGNLPPDEYLSRIVAVLLTPPAEESVPPADVLDDEPPILAAKQQYAAPLKLRPGSVPPFLPATEDDIMELAN